MLLKDRPFRKQGRASNNISPLDRLALIGDRGMGMLGDVPPDPMQLSPDDLSLLDMAKAMQTVLQGRDNVLLKQLSMLGGSPHGARPKVLLRLAPASGAATTRDDHAKNFTYRMARDGSFQLSPCCDLGFDPGPVSGHQRAVMGEGAAPALDDLLRLATDAALPERRARDIIAAMVTRAGLSLSWPAMRQSGPRQ